MATQTDHEQWSHRLVELEAAVHMLQSAMHGFADEIRTRQLVVVDDKNHPKIVGEVFGDVAELRLELPGPDGPGAEVLLFAVASTHPGPIELGPAVGFQLRTQGRAVAELEAWPGPDGVWRPHLHLSGS